MKIKTWWALAFVLPFLFGFLLPAPEGGNGLVGKKAPPLSGTDLHGNRIDLDSLRGKVVVVNFWMMGCPPCMYEVPVLNEMNRKFGGRDDFYLFSVAPHTAEDLRAFNQSLASPNPFNGIRKYMKIDTLGYPILAECSERARGNSESVIGADCNTLDKKYVKGGYPWTFFIDKKGVVRFVEDGFAVGETLAKELRNKYLRQAEQLLAE